MADILQGSRAFLVANVPLAALVSTRIYALQLPQNPTLPAITYQVISDVHEVVQSGPVGFPSARVQYNCYGVTLEAAEAVYQALRLAVDGYAGMMGGVKVWLASVANKIDQLDPDTKRYKAIVDVIYIREE